MDLSKLESKKVLLESCPFNLIQLLHNISKPFEINNKNNESIKFSLDIPIEYNKYKINGIYVYGDENKLAQVLINIVGNAVKFTKKGISI